MKEGKVNQVVEKVSEKITKGEVRMKPRFQFLLRSLSWLAVAGLLFLAATFLVSVNAHYICKLEPLDMLAIDPAALVGSFPYILLVATVGVLFLAAKSYRRSRNYCRHENWMLLGVLAFGAILIGFSIYYAHLEHRIRVALEKKDFFDSMVVTPKEFWTRPQQGMLSGVVLKENKDGSFMLESWDGRRWKVINLEKSYSLPERKNVALESSNIQLDSDVPFSAVVVKMTGRKSKEGEFKASKFWKW